MASSTDQLLSSDVIVQEPIFEIIVKRLREEIIRGIHSPGAPLRLKDIAQKFGTSLMPVREALHRLTSEELIVMHPRKGATVSSLDNRKMKDVYELRKVLLGYASRMGVQNMKDHDFSALRGKLDEMRRLLKKDPVDLNHFAVLNIEFHRTITNRLGNALFDRLLSINDNFSRMWTNQLSLDRSRLEESLQEHEELYEAAKSGDGDRIEKLVHKHIDGTYQALAEILDAS